MRPRQYRKRQERTMSPWLVLFVLGSGAFVVWWAVRSTPTPTTNTNRANTPTNTTEINASTANATAVEENANATNSTNAAENTNAVNNNRNIGAEVVNTNFAANTTHEIVHGDTTKKQVVFSFDAGSGTQSAQAILDTLKTENVHATFFVTGTWVSKNTSLVQKIASAGHEIFNHTYSHPHLPALTDTQIADELNKTDTLVVSATGKSTKPYFRAPYGDRNAHVLSVAAEQGYTSIYWTLDALDWEESTGMTAAKVKTRILDHVAPGEIYLMHVGDTITGTILKDVLDGIKKRGYSVVPLGKAL